jgi:hypothetical protein
MPLDPNNPDAWIEEISVNEPTLVKRLCKSLYHEPLLVRWPAHALLCKWGMTADGRIGVPEDPLEFNATARPGQDRLLGQDDAQFALLVRQEDPNVLEPGPANPWPFAVAAFKRGGGVVPVVAAEGCEWRVVHLYETLTHLVVGNRVDSERAGRHFTQAAAFVALHGVAQSAMRQYPSIQSVLRAKAFALFSYDPLAYFAPDKEHDNCGFVIRD